MKAEVCEAAADQEQKYPMLKRHPVTGLIVLFSCACTGTVVSHKGSVHVIGGHVHAIGDMATDWLEREFQIFNGRLTLSNDFC